MVTRRSSLIKLALAITLSFLVFLHVLLSGLFSHGSKLFSNSARQTVDLARFFENLDKYAIDAPLIKNKYKTEKAVEHSSNEQSSFLSKEYLENVLDIPDTTVEKFKQSHHGIVHEYIPDMLQNAKVDTFGVIRRTSPDWNQYVTSKGYVLIGGGKYSWLSYLVIKQIRASGGVLPAEVFIPSQAEYETRFCEDILPKLNSRCNVLNATIADTLKTKFNLGGYQFKMLAVLTSKFGNVLYLDLDLFPTKNVEYLFESQLFKKKGLIIWPDNWARTTSPKFHEIAEFPVLENKVRYSEYDKHNHAGPDGKVRPLSEFTFKDLNFHDFENALPNPSSEAGVLMINKTSHVRSMLLALYYNVYGPEYYYPLMTQGSAGEGDKETFIAAAVVLGEPYFQTRKQFRWIGYHNKEQNGFASKGLGHFDPVTSTEDSEDAPIVFMHCLYPKYYTDWLYNNHDLVYKDGEHIRMYQGIYDNIGYDFDLRLQQFFVQGVCKDYYVDGKAPDSNLLEADEWAGNFLEYIGADLEVNEKRCKEVFIPHLKWLQKTTPFPQV